MSDVMATCCDCGTRFFREAAEHWKTRCIPCFKASKGKQESGGLATYWEKRARELDSENNELADAYSALEAETERLRETVCKLQQQKPSSSPQWLIAEFREQIRRLLLCCHPDKHGNSEAATKATQFLLRVRDTL